MRLCNFSNTQYHLNWYGTWAGLKTFLDQEALDGVELLLHGNYDIEKIPKDMVKGLHLSYFPTWVDFYNQDPIYLEDFPTPEAVIQTFGHTSPREMIERFRKDYAAARRLAVHYMVFHVGHVRTKDAFTFNYDYDNRSVLEATIALVNESFTEDSDIELLFENLWWPGLQLLDPQELEYFMSKIRYKKKGVMLDLSHLLLTTDGFNHPDEAADYILERIEALGESKHWIKGVHINGTFHGDYFHQDHLNQYEALSTLDKEARFMAIYKHISAMDQHIPLATHKLKAILKALNVKYEMIELVGRDRLTWEGLIRDQQRYLCF